MGANSKRKGDLGYKCKNDETKKIGTNIMRMICAVSYGEGKERKGESANNSEKYNVRKKE